MIYSTTPQPHPGRPVLLREAPGAVRRARDRGHGRRCSLIDYRRLRDLSMFVYVRHRGPARSRCSRPLGSNIKGHQAWFQLPGGFTLQPSELAKFGIIVALAGYCNQYRGELDAWRLTVILGLAARPARAGAAPARPRHACMVLAVIIVGLLAVAGVSGRQLLVLGLLALTGVYAVVEPRAAEAVPDRPAHHVPRSRERHAARAPAYNQEQSIQTIANGRTTGEGIWNGHADPGRLRARAAHRLHLHRGGGGARLRRARRRSWRCSPS